MKIITNDNIDHLTSMAYSDNVNKVKDKLKLNNIYEKIRNITKGHEKHNYILSTKTTLESHQLQRRT